MFGFKKGTGVKSLQMRQQAAMRRWIDIVFEGKPSKDIGEPARLQRQIKDIERKLSK